jgi:hypothetical protein
VLRRYAATRYGLSSKVTILTKPLNTLPRNSSGAGTICRARGERMLKLPRELINAQHLVRAKSQMARTAKLGTMLRK